MKFKPTKIGKNPSQRKNQYEVVIEDSHFTTYAYNEEAALSNACFRYASDVDEDVALIKWQVRNEKLYSNVEEV
jgi:hypothetical protein